MSEKSLFAFRLRRLLALAQNLFRQDAVFRYAVIGGGLALLALLSRFGDAPAPVSAPFPAPSALPPVAQSLSAPVPPPASLGTEYGAAPESKRPPEPVSHDPPRIAPSHSLDELGAAQNPRPAPDRFGV
ncbi:MAG: hypothetical protein WB816_07515, partial [Methylocystis sp.]